MDPASKRGTSKKADYYGTFLEAVKEQQSTVQQESPRQESPRQDSVQREFPLEVVPPAGDALPAPAEGAESEFEVVDPIALLKALRDAGGPQGMSQLQATTNLRFSSFAEVVAKLEEAGLLRITGTPGSEKVELMPAGATLAELG